MRLLLDTHFLVWMATDRSAIRPTEQSLIVEGQLFVSPVSIWELRIKWQLFDRNGIRKGTFDPNDALTYIATSQIELVDLTGQDCAAALPEPLAHKDPFDEMLLIHAQQLGAKLLTRDRHLLNHPLAVQL